MEGPLYPDENVIQDAVNAAANTVGQAAADTSQTVLIVAIIAVAVVVVAVAAIIITALLTKSKRNSSAPVNTEKPSAVQPDAEENAVFCSKCGKKLRPSAVFCNSCGQKIPDDPDKAMRKG